MKADELESTLSRGELEIEGRIVESSNAAFLCRLRATGVRCIYKPVQGERPLWDFPDATLGRREVATFELARLAGWDVVPTTAWREEGPFGPGMCQRWVEATGNPLVEIIPAHHDRPGWHVVLEGEEADGSAVRLVHADQRELQHVALLDAVANNADRKGGHLLIDEDQHVWAIDHGVCFHPEPKLRTVLWGWAGSAIDDASTRELEGLRASLRSAAGTAVGRWLTDEEFSALHKRLDALIETRRYPVPSLEWPVIPWPVM